MAITYRSVKGAALTHTELDDNFTTLTAVDAATDVDVAAIDVRTTALEDTFVVVPGSGSASFSDISTQNIAVTNTAQVVAFNTQDNTPRNVTHSVSLNNDRIQLDAVGRWSLGFELQVQNGSGAHSLYAWMQVSTNAGTTWTNVANSGVFVDLLHNTAGVLVLTQIYDVSTAGAMVRCMIQGDSTNLELNHKAAAGNVPAIPSAISTVQLIGPYS